MNNFMKKGLTTTVATLITIGVMAFGLSRDTAKEIVYNFKNNHPNKATERTAKGTHTLNQQAAKFRERVSEIFATKSTTLEGGNGTPQDHLDFEKLVVQKGLVNNSFVRSEAQRNPDNKIFAMKFCFENGEIIVVNASDPRLQEPQVSPTQTPEDSLNQARETVSDNKFNFDANGNILYPQNADKHQKALYDDYNQHVPSHAKMDLMLLQQKLQNKGLSDKEVRLYTLDAFTMLVYVYNLKKRFRYNEDGTVSVGPMGGFAEESFIRFDYDTNNTYDADFLAFMRGYDDEDNLPTKGVFAQSSNSGNSNNSTNSGTNSNSSNSSNSTNSSNTGTTTEEEFDISSIYGDEDLGAKLKEKEEESKKLDKSIENEKDNNENKRETIGEQNKKIEALKYRDDLINKGMKATEADKKMRAKYPDIDFDKK